MNQEALVVGADLGGTSTRVVVANIDGEVRGSGRGAGGNPTAWPAGQAAAALAAAVSDALQGVDPAAVQAVVLGMAGSSALDDPATAEHFDSVWNRAGIRCAPRVVGDLETAFASATPEPDGTVVVSGTGAAAATIRDRAIVRSADGYGWLLGDAGSGFWIGREAVRHTLARLDGTMPPTVLTDSVLLSLLGAAQTGSDDAKALVRDLLRTVHSRPPVQLSQLVKVVEMAADQGDAAAGEIIERASLELIRTVERVREPADATALVTVGGVLRPGSAVSRSLRTHLAERFAGPVLAATDGVAGATWLAARSITKDETREAASHQRLTGQANA